MHLAGVRKKKEIYKLSDDMKETFSKLLNHTKIPCYIVSTLTFYVQNLGKFGEHLETIRHKENILKQ